MAGRAEEALSQIQKAPAAPARKREKAYYMSLNAAVIQAYLGRYPAALESLQTLHLSYLQDKSGGLFVTEIPLLEARIKMMMPDSRPANVLAGLMPGSSAASPRDWLEAGQYALDNGEIRSARGCFFTATD